MECKGCGAPLGSRKCKYCGRFYNEQENFSNSILSNIKYHDKQIEPLTLLKAMGLDLDKQLSRSNKIRKAARCSFR